MWFAAFAVAAALPWSVPDAGTAARLRADLDALWPGHDVVVVVGPVEAGDRLVFGPGVIWLFAAGRRYERPWDGRTDTAAVQARTWLREMRLVDGGWRPDLPEAPPDAFDVIRGPEPVEPPRPPLVTLPKVRYAIGLGGRTPATEPLALDGPRVLAGAYAGPLGLEADLFAAAGSYLRENQLDRALREFVASREAWLDVFGLAVQGTFGVEPPESGPFRFRAGPSARVGGELRRSVLRETRYDGEDFEVVLHRDVAIWDFGPVIGAGVDVWLGARGRFRVAMVDRLRFRANHPGGAWSWSHDPGLAFDVIVVPGA